MNFKILVIILTFEFFHIAMSHIAMPQPRMAGGDTATEGKIPYQVALLLEGGHRCGGSIISKNYIVTAAHCFFEKDVLLKLEYFSIRAGSIHWADGGIVRQISERILHPDYKCDKQSCAYDIALLKLKEPLVFSEQIQPIALATSDPPDNSNVLISGWGVDCEDGNCESVRELQYLYSTHTRQDCDGKTHICLQDPFGKGPCEGDSGGPAAYNNKLVGVASFIITDPDGIECGSGLPSAYTRVSQFNKWIIKNSDLKVE